MFKTNSERKEEPGPLYKKNVWKVERMSSDKKTSRLLGASFHLQALASMISGLFLLQPLIDTGNIVGTMTNIAGNVSQMRASIVVEMITAMGIVMLGTILYATLKKQNNRVALVALGMYILEASILAMSRIPAFTLLSVSRESVIAGHSVYLQTMGTLFYELQDFGYSLHMLPFALGATMFYYLFYRAGYIPRALNLLGLIAAPLASIGTLFTLLGIEVPIFVFLPNLPFELGIGLWLISKGVRVATENGENSLED